MDRLRITLLLLSVWSCNVVAFQSLLLNERPATIDFQLFGTSTSSSSQPPNECGSVSRSAFLQTALTSLTVAATASILAPSAACAADDPPETPVGISVFQLPSGLKYLDLVVGTGTSPGYGQLCSIQYNAYIKLPASKDDPNPAPVQFDNAPAYLMKHGNGRSVAGLDEGLHNMKVGGRRRILVPPKLGYVESGLGPIPEYPWDRWRLNSMLDKMVALKGGTIIFEVTMLSIMDDEADQGYYQDKGLSAEEYELLQRNLNQKTAGAQPGN